MIQVQDFVSCVTMKPLDTFDFGSSKIANRSTGIVAGLLFFRTGRGLDLICI